MVRIDKVVVVVWVREYVQEAGRGLHAMRWLVKFLEDDVSDEMCGGMSYAVWKVCVTADPLS